jgi:hypothetical protein
MATQLNKLYLILFIACLSGYIWIYFNLSSNIIENKTAIVCPIKHFIGLPCPSCGSTRSVISLLKGNFAEAFYINPIGYLIATIMVVLPLWIFSDVLLRQNSLQHFYMKLERRIVKPMFAIPLILLLIMNWFWNISKSL